MSMRVIASCSGCTTRWTGMHTAHCPTCHTTFASIKAFDHHRADQTCKPPGLSGLVPRVRSPRELPAGFVVWGFPGNSSTGGVRTEHREAHRGGRVGRPPHRIARV